MRLLCSLHLAGPLVVIEENMTIKYSDKIDCNKLEDYYSKEVEINTSNIELDLKFESQKLSNDGLKILNTCLTELPNIIKNLWQWVITKMEKT